MIKRTTIDAILEKIDIVELAEQSGLSLQRSGADYKALCPVHSERSPSFYIKPNNQTFKCFGCGIGGDAISFLQAVDGWDFSGAVQALGDLAGIEVVDEQGDDPEYLRKKTYYEMLKLASWFYRSNFAKVDDSHPARQNLANRNYLYVEGRDTWLDDFGIGYAPTGNLLLHLFQSKGYSREQMLDSGLIKENISERDGRTWLQDRLRDRVLWEIRDIKGRVLGFSGRRLNDDENDEFKGPKYVNPPETILYKKSKVLVGIDIARKRMAETKTCYVVEGAADVQALAAVDAVNTVASCGTAFGSEHASIIRRIIDEFDSKDHGKFVFVFDGDEAGLKATRKVFEDIKPSIKDRAYVASLGGLDPVDYRKEFGDEELKKRLEEAIPITEFMINGIAVRYDMSKIEDRSGFAREAMELISQIHEPDIHEAYRKKISFISGISTNHLHGSYSQKSNKPVVAYEYEPPPEYEDSYLSEEFPPDDYEPVPVSDNSLDKLTGLLAAFLLQYPKETFSVLYPQPDIMELLGNERLKGILIEGMNKAGYTAFHGNETVLRPHDFSNPDDTYELFHLPLGAEITKIEDRVKRIITHIKDIIESEGTQAIRAAVATNQMNAEDALLLLAAQFKAKRK